MANPGSSQTATASLLMRTRLSREILLQARRSRTSIRFHPNSRASTDHAPGPSNARAIPIVAKRRHANAWLGCENALQRASTATAPPAIGVHKPTRRVIPEAIARTSNAARGMGAPPSIPVNPRVISAIPATSRINRRPRPGKPRANVENRRCKKPFSSLSS